jgi:1-acyl-sn-glycerol-3-phosphate acyltransferase
MAGADHPFPVRFVQLLGILVLRAWMRVGFRCRVERHPDSMVHPAVYACNHRSFADPPLVGMWQRPPSAYFARSSLWKVPIIRETLNLFYGIPVERENPGMSSMKGAVDRLRRGVSVVVFPEGTRTRTGRLGRLRDGPALFARRAGVPLVPVYVHRSEAVWPRGAVLPRICGPTIRIRFGAPIVPPSGLDPRQQDAWVTRRLEAWMRLQERRCRPPYRTGLS